jgi:ATP-dependent DNA helicase DinG
MAPLSHKTNMVEFRQTQQRAIIEIIKAIKAGKTDILVQAPTGTGKSLIALELAKIMHERKGWKSFVLTSEKLLQSQYERDCSGKYDRRYESAASISGIDNYECHVNSEKFSLGHCRMMGLSNRQALELPCAHRCDYLQKWSRAQESPYAIFNYSYYLLQMNYVFAQKMGETAPFQPRPLVICDEAHALPGVIEGHFACYVDQSFAFKIREMQGLLDRSRVITPFNKLSTSLLSRQVDTIMKIKIEDSHSQLKALTELYKILTDHREVVNKSKLMLSERFNIKLPDGDDESAYIKASQQAINDVPESVTKFFKLADELKDYVCKIEDYIKIITEHGVHNMVAEASSEVRRTYHNLSDVMLFQNHFEPFSKVRVYLSATLQPKNLIERWGLDPDATHVIVLNSGWDPSNSPIRLTNTANFKHNNSEEAIQAAVAKVDQILDLHPGERGLIHTTSYKITKALMDGCTNRDRLVNYEGTREKMELLEGVESLADDAVLVGPSLVQGIDLPDDLARFNVIVKLSYPDVSSRLWKARLQLKKGIYLAETANRLEQSSGRSTRHAEDRSVTYVLDSRAEKFVFSPNTAQYLSEEFVQRVLAGE